MTDEINELSDLKDSVLNPTTPEEHSLKLLLEVASNILEGETKSDVCAYLKSVLSRKILAREA